MDECLPLMPAARHPSSAAQWGDWRLGDLWGALFRATAVLGPEVRVDQVLVVQPSGADVLPAVHITVVDEAAVHRLRGNLLTSEHLPRFLQDSSGSRFRAEMHDVLLDVRIPAGEE